MYKQEYNIRYYSKNWELHLWQSAKTRAKRSGIEFSIAKSDIIIPKYCPYLGTKLTKIHGKGRNIKTNSSLDRIDPSKGYIPGNVEVVSFQANRMKADASTEELLIFANAIKCRF